MKTTKIMDIAKPGELKSSDAASGRPVIVTNRVIVQDPMVNTEAEPAKKSEPTVAELAVTAAADKASEKQTVKGKLVISPLTDSESSEEDDKATKDTAKKEGLLDLPIADATPDEETEDAHEKPSSGDAESSTTTDTTESTEATEEDNPVSAKGGSKAAAKEEAESKAKEELDQLVEDKEYFLPINAAEHRRSLLVVVFGAILILVLAAAWVNIALDAGLIDIPGVKPLTDFFG